MRTPGSKTLTLLAAAAILVVGADVASYAANGRPLLLGQANSESATATVKNTGTGAALSLKTRAGSPPLKVSSSKVVKKLNADTVDGSHAAALKTNAITYAIPAGTTASFTLRLENLPAGVYLGSFDIFMTSGGAATSVCYLTGEGGDPQLWSYGAVYNGNYASNSATGLVTVSAGQAFYVVCSIGGVVSGGGAPSQVTLVPVSRVKSHSVTELPRTGIPTHPRTGR